MIKAKWLCIKEGREKEQTYIVWLISLNTGPLQYLRKYLSIMWCG